MKKINFEKDKFNNIVKSLELKYKLVYKKLPHVGDSFTKLGYNFRVFAYKQIYNRKSRMKGY